jgi:hypothetical protein
LQVSAKDYVFTRSYLYFLGAKITAFDTGRGEKKEGFLHFLKNIFKNPKM